MELRKGTLRVLQEEVNSSVRGLTLASCTRSAAAAAGSLHASAQPSAEAAKKARTAAGFSVRRAGCVRRHGA